MGEKHCQGLYGVRGPGVPVRGDESIITTIVGSQLQYTTRHPHMPAFTTRGDVVCWLSTMLMSAHTEPLCQYWDARPS